MSVYAQEFSPLKKEYKLNEKTMLLETVGNIDIVEQIQSAKPSTLQEIYDRYTITGDAGLFLKSGSYPVQPLEELDHLNDIADDLTYLKEKYNLPADTSIKELKAFVLANEKGVDKNVKTNENKKEQEVIQDVSQENPPQEP